jgi:hypothetical protein
MSLDGVYDAVYEVVLVDGETEEIRGATGYVQEGPLTTFFCSERSRATLDSWSERLASFRTADIRRILRRDRAGLRAVTQTEDAACGVAG